MHITILSVSYLLDLQNKLMALETEVNSKNQEIQNLHSSLTDTIVSKEQVEQKVIHLLEAHSMPDESLQQQAQVSTLSHPHIWS